MNVDLSALSAAETEALAAGLLAPDDEELSLQAATFSADERRRLAKRGEAMSDGSFPIRNKADLRNAISAFGRAADPGKAKAWIRRRARELGAEDLLPEDWGAQTASVASEEDAPMEEDNERYAKRLCPHCGGDLDDEPMAASAGTEVLESEPPLMTEDEWAAADWLTASAAGMAPEVPPREWFEVPEASEPTPLTITADGQVYGHAALWNTCHTGIPGRCTTPPRSSSGYRYFHLGAVEADDGSTVATGKITFGAGHAPLTASRAGTAAHYDNTAHAGADVVARDGRHGIWVAGALRPGLPARAVKTLKAAALSGDWRAVNGALELIGLLAVNVPGFPVPRANALVSSATEEVGLVEESGEVVEFSGEEPVLALVAAGIVVRCEPCEQEAALDALLAPLTADAGAALDELTAEVALDQLLGPNPSPRLIGEKPGPRLIGQQPYVAPNEQQATVPQVVDDMSADEFQRRMRMLAARSVGDETLAVALENAPVTPPPAAPQQAPVIVNVNLPPAA